MNNGVKLALLAFSAVCAACAGAVENKLNSRKEILSDRYEVEWVTDFSEKAISFNVRVNTTGYVGFGLSVTGGMVGADIVIGGVSPNGDIYFNDYHGDPSRNNKPVLDEVQNWMLTEGYEEAGVTTLNFIRSFNTFDPDDIKITDGTLKIIWSIGETDNINYHGSENRGALGVNLLDPSFGNTDLSEFQQGKFTLNVRMGWRSTYYSTQYFKRSSIHKSSIVAFQPYLKSPEALRHTHHFNFYKCNDLNEDMSTGHEHIVQILEKEWYCFNETSVYAWSFGGRILVFPEDVGMLWGKQSTEYFRLEAHLDNSNPNISFVSTFETGVIVYHTKLQRKKEAGIFVVGHNTGPSLLIPPNTSNWTIVGHCSPNCTLNGMDENGINLFNLNLHTHKSGRRVRVRHFRGSTELPWIINDETYSFEYQENRPMTKTVQILPGDQVTMECTYDSNWKSPKLILGGTGSEDEMCMFFAYYYADRLLENENCFSKVSEKEIYKFLRITDWGWNYRGASTHLNYVKWTDKLKAGLQDKLYYGKHVDDCMSPYDESFIQFPSNLVSWDDTSTPDLVDCSPLETTAQFHVKQTTSPPINIPTNTESTATHLNLMEITSTLNYFSTNTKSDSVDGSTLAISLFLVVCSCLYGCCWFLYARGVCQGSCGRLNMIRRNKSSYSYSNSFAEAGTLETSDSD